MIVLLLIQTVVEKNADGRAVNVWLLGVAFMAGAITWYWVQGVRQRPPRPARFGAIAGAAVGVFYKLLELLLVARYPSWWTNVALILQSALAWGLIGFAGGTAIEQGAFSRGGVRVGAGVAAGTAAFGILAFAFVRPFPWPQYLLIAVGWGLGIMLHRPADAVLGIEPSAGGAAANQHT